MKVPGTGTLMRTASFGMEGMAETKVDEAKAALERGSFEEALQLIEAAQLDQPQDPQARELYVVTHLAKAIRLSEKARETQATIAGGFMFIALWVYFNQPGQVTR